MQLYCDSIYDQFNFCKCGWNMESNSDEQKLNFRIIYKPTLDFYRIRIIFLFNYGSPLFWWDRNMLYIIVISLTSKIYNEKYSILLINTSKLQYKNPNKTVTPAKKTSSCNYFSSTRVCCELKEETIEYFVWQKWNLKTKENEYAACNNSF